MGNSLIEKANIKLYPKKLFYPPEWLVLGVNNICNLHCKMCDVGVQYQDSNFYQNLVGTHPINMPRELIFKIIDEASQYFPKIKLGYAFTEPIIYPHLIESLQYANARNIYTSITTNGLTLKRSADALVEAGLNDLFISLDGPPAIHNEIRGHKQSFEKAVEGIEAILSKPSGPEVSVFCVITEWNIGHMLEFLNYFKRIPLKQVGFMHTNFTTDEMAAEHNLHFGNAYPATASNMEEIDIAKMDLAKLSFEIAEIKKGSYPFPVSFSPDLNGTEELNTFYHQPEKKIGKRCNDVFRALMIKSDGSIIPAHGRCYNLTVGNIYDNTLKEIWNSSHLSNFRNKLMKSGGLMPACTRCCSAF